MTEDDREERIAAALLVIERFGMIDGPHHKQWVLDQVLRHLLAEGYAAWIDAYNAPDPETGEDYAPWDTGVAP